MSEWVNSSELDNRLGNKLLLAGLSEAGKTAVKKLYFQNSKLDEITGLSATLNYERLTTTINDVPITILDLGGQRVFIKRFLSGFSPFVFSSVRGLIFLIDTSIKGTRNNSIQYFAECVKKLDQFSPKAEVFVYLHKTDLIKSQPNYDTVLQLLMEQFQIEARRKIRFFFTSIYEPETVINSFLRIFEIIIPEKLSSKIVGQIEKFASVKFTSKNIDILDLQRGDQQEVEETFNEATLNQRGDSLSINQPKLAGDLESLMDIQNLMKAASKTEAEDPEAFKEQAKFENLANLQKIIKKGIAEPVQIKFNRNLSYISEVFQEETYEDINLSPIEKELKKEAISKQILDTLQSQVKQKSIEEEKVSHMIEESVEESKPLTTFEQKVKEFSSFYGINTEDAENIIKANFVDLFNELVMRSNVPIESVLQVLLVNIPFLKVMGNDISSINDHVIVIIFKYLMIGKINERQVYEALEEFVKSPGKSIEEIVGRY
jgi:Ras-related GTP-binding protein A/B